MLRGALASILSKKAVTGELKIINELSAVTSKTKEMANIVSNLAGVKSALLVVSKKEKNVIRAAANLKKVDAIRMGNLGLYEALNHKYILIDKKAVEEMKK